MSLNITLLLRSSILGVLDYNEDVVSVRSDHDLMLLKLQKRLSLQQFLGTSFTTDLSSDPEECEIIGWVQLFEHCLGLIHQVVEQPRVLDSRGIVKSGLYWDTISVDYDGSDHTLVGNQPLQCFLHL